MRDFLNPKNIHENCSSSQEEFKKSFFKKRLHYLKRKRKKYFSVIKQRKDITL